MSRQGKVWLVGAGPGDVGLFTIKGKDILAKAEVVVSSSFNSNLISVDFPEPLFPTINTNSPLSMCSDTSFKAGWPLA